MSIVVILPLTPTGLNIPAGLLAWSILAMRVQGSIINGCPPSSDMLRSNLWPFMWRLLVLLVLPALILPLWLFFSWLPVDRKLGFYGLLTISIAITSVTALSCFSLGTWLPAVVAAKGDRSYQAAKLRGRLTFRYVALRLLLCLVIIAVAAMFLRPLAFMGSATAMVLIFGESAGMYAVLVGFLATGILSALGFVLLVVVASVILSRAYLLAEAQRQIG